MLDPNQPLQTANRQIIHSLSTGACE